MTNSSIIFSTPQTVLLLQTELLSDMFSGIQELHCMFRLSRASTVRQFLLIYQLFTYSSKSEFSNQVTLFTESGEH